MNESEFCGVEGFGPFTNSSLRVDFTPCFEESVLLLIPKLLVVFFGILRIFQVAQKPAATFTIASFNYYAKVGFSVVAFLLYFVELILKATTDGLESYEILSTVFSVLASLTAAILVAIEQRRVKRSSPILLIYWLGIIGASIFRIRTLVLMGLTNDYLFVFFCVETGFALVLSALLLMPFPTAKGEYRAIGEDEKSSPEITANFLSVLSFSWITPLMVLGSKKTLAHEDLWALNPQDEASAITKNFEAAWADELKKEKPSLVRALAYAFGGPFLFAAFFKLAQDILQFIQPVLLSKLIDFIESYCDDCPTQEPTYRGYLIAAGMFFAAVTQTIFLHQYFHRCLVTGMRVRAALATAVYKKSFTLSNDSKQKSTVGEMVNLMQIDAQRLMDLCSYAQIIWSAPIQIIFAILLLYQVLGPAVFTGLVVMLSLIPANAWVANIMKNSQQAQMKAKDTRTKLMDEILNGIKVIKLYAWENSFLQKVRKVRHDELSALEKIAWGGAFQNFSWSCAPFVVSVTSFIFYIVFEQVPLSSNVAFVSLSLFNLLQFPLTILPNVIFAMIQASVSVNRLYDFLTAQELDPNNVTRSAAGFSVTPGGSFDKLSAVAINAEQGAAPVDHLVTITQGYFQWAKTASKPVLENINLSVPDESIVAVVGSVGSGKSSLISAILGDMEKISGHVRVKGSVAFVPQQAWVMNATLRENIVFGHAFDEEFYNKVIAACALLPDIDILPAGDATEIGERGINLSGGQKQRVSLARAVYSRADVYLLDDPLSAVDAHVGRHIFEKVIGPNGLLKNTCRIFVTHAIQYLPKCHQVLVLKNGKVSEIGGYDELMAIGGEFSELIKEYSTHGDTEHAEEKPEGEKTNKDKDQEEKSKLMTKEVSEVGQVHASVYKLYFGAMGLKPVISLFALYTLGVAVSVASNIWLSYWASQNSNDDVELYIGVYAGLGIAFSLVIVAQALVAYVVCGVRAARKIHDGMLANIFRVPMSFFDTTPLGRILNRFSKDQNTVDEVLPRTYHDYFSTLFDVIGILFVISYSTIYFMIAIIPLGVLYFLIQRYYLATSRELKRLDSISKSPMYSHFSETLNGVNTIRAYGQRDRFIKENETRINHNQIAYYPSIASNRWLATRLEFVGSIVVLLSAVFAVAAFGVIDSATVGLSVTYALSVTQTLNWMVRMSCDLEANIVSVERIKEYTTLKNEAPDVIPGSRPPPSWPNAGAVKFQNYSTRYREGLDLVLKGISCHFSPSEKIGVVGRTGAGKSSLTLALFRLIEPAAGEIIVDDLNVATIGLHDLRSHLTIIPQDPVLFTGTLRENLDPFNEATDEQVWNALECASLKEFASQVENKLEYGIIQGGDNLSVGQRQLVCLARALLRKTKILVLDEATAAVDVETDAVIQKTIRDQFRDCTIITIAHRINTIMDNDRIMVLDAGRIAEFDTPKSLLSDTSSIFYSMAKQSGLVASATNDTQ